MQPFLTDADRTIGHFGGGGGSVANGILRDDLAVVTRSYVRPRYHVARPLVPCISPRYVYATMIRAGERARDDR